MSNKLPPTLSGGLPVLGHALAFRKDRTTLLRRGHQELGDIFALRLANQNVAVVIGPENQKVFFTETDKKLDMAKPYAFIRAIFGDLAFLGSPMKYKEQRKIIHAPFRREKMRQYIRIMQDQVQAWLDSLSDEGEMSIVSEVGRVVQNVAGYALMGEAFQKQVGREFWDLYSDLSAALDPLIPPNWPLPKFRRRDRAKARMIEILQPIITERRAHPERYDDFLQDFIDARDINGRLLKDDEVISLILGFNFAGHETTTGQAAWTIILLLQNPWYLDKLQEEIDRQLPIGDAITDTAMREMMHVQWAIRETERMRPSADMLMRYAQEDVQFGDYIVPKGWLVQTTAMVAHFLPKLFKDPYAYDPLRFAPGREEGSISRFALIGFGGGLHKCAGMNFANNEMFVITSLLFQQFDLTLVTPEPKIIYGMGAAHPGETIVHFRRKRPSKDASYLKTMQKESR
ncbi:MAG: hypothetical protein DSY55_06050 [Clostridia bacterium]|nr:MAG: hypothetical protein DSY55_06050 [Clostridia bacterium]